MASSLLCSLAATGNVEQVEIMVDASALVDITDQRGYSALMCAAENVHSTYAAQILLEAGATVNYAVVRVAAYGSQHLYGCIAWFRGVAMGPQAACPVVYVSVRCVSLFSLTLALPRCTSHANTAAPAQYLYCSGMVRTPCSVTYVRPAKFYRLSVRWRCG